VPTLRFLESGRDEVVEFGAERRFVERYNPAVAHNLAAGNVDAVGPRGITEDQGC
jgi:hypothetical protein